MLFYFYLIFILYWSIVDLLCVCVYLHSLFRFFSHISYYRILSRVPYAVLYRQKIDLVKRVVFKARILGFKSMLCCYTAV